MALQYLVYVSSATQHFSENDLEVLLSKSRENNHRLAITGMLLYSDENFIQVIEGEADALSTLYAKIKIDSRHQGFMELIREDIETRSFPEWTMGFKKISKDDYSGIAGFEKVEGVRSRSIDKLQQPAILNFLKTFLKINSKDARYM